MVRLIEQSLPGAGFVPIASAARCGEVVWSWGARSGLVEPVRSWGLPKWRNWRGFPRLSANGVVSPMNNYRAPCSLRES